MLPNVFGCWGEVSSQKKKLSRSKFLLACERQALEEMMGNTLERVETAGIKAQR